MHQDTPGTAAPQRQGRRAVSPLTVLGVLGSVAFLARRQRLEISPALHPRPHFEVHRRAM